MFAAFTEEFLAAPFTEQVFHFVLPALADAQAAFPFEPFLEALLAAERERSGPRGGAPWLFYVVLTVGESYLGTSARQALPSPTWVTSREGAGAAGLCWTGPRAECWPALVGGGHLSSGHTGSGLQRRVGERMRVQGCLPVCATRQLLWVAVGAGQPRLSEGRMGTAALPSVGSPTVSGCHRLFPAGTLSEEGLLVYLRVLQTFLSQLPVSPARPSCQDSASDSEDDSTEADQQRGAPVSSGRPWSCTRSTLGRPVVSRWVHGSQSARAAGGCVGCEAPPPGPPPVPRGPATVTRRPRVYMGRAAWQQVTVGDHSLHGAGSASGPHCARGRRCPGRALRAPLQGQTLPWGSPSGPSPGGAGPCDPARFQPLKGRRLGPPCLAGRVPGSLWSVPPASRPVGVRSSLKRAEGHRRSSLPGAPGIGCRVFSVLSLHATSLQIFFTVRSPLPLTALLPAPCRVFSREKSCTLHAHTRRVSISLKWCVCLLSLSHP